MKKISGLKIMMLALLLSGGICFSAQAFLLPPGPFTPTMDAPTDVGFTLKNVGSAAQQLATQAQTFANTQVQALKALKKKYGDKFTGFMGGIFKKKEKQPIPGSKTIQKSKIADIYDPASVKKAIYTLFLAYPVNCNKNSDNKGICLEYRHKGEEFYQDTVIEVYTSVRELEKQIPTLEAQVAQLSDTLRQGGDGAETGEDENGVWKNAYNAYDTLDSILKVTEEVVAMKAQYEAALSIRDQIVPAPYLTKKERKEKEKAAKGEQHSSIFRPEPVLMAVSEPVAYEETLAFGQLSAISNSSLQRADFQFGAAAPVEAEEDDEEEDYEYDPDAFGSITYQDAPAPKISSPFAGNEDKLLELDKLAPLYEKVTKAVEVHNLLQSLESYRDMFEKYEQYVKLHQKSLEALAGADQCAIQYLGRYYNDPEKVWSGGNLGSQINNYDLRSGISGWAVKSYDIAKAENANQIDTDDLADIPLDMDMDTSNAADLEKTKAELEKQNLQGFADESTAAEAEKINRETTMLSFNIGSQAAQMLVEDQYKKKPQWGAPAVKFPIWHDLQGFYSQYLDNKYNNIKEYLHQYDVNQVIVDIAYKVNDLTVTDPEEKNNNRTGLNKLSAALKAEAESQDPAYVLQNLENNRQKLLDQALSSKQAKLRPLEAQKSRLIAQIDKASQLMDDYNRDFNQLGQDKQKADLEIESTEDQIEYLNERRGEPEENTYVATELREDNYDVEISPEITRDDYSVSIDYNESEREIVDDDAVAAHQELMQDLQYQNNRVNMLNKKAAAQDNTVYKTKTITRQQLIPIDVQSNNDGSLSLYPESDAAPAAPVRSLFRQRPGLDKSSALPDVIIHFAADQPILLGAGISSAADVDNLRPVARKAFSRAGALADEPAAIEEVTETTTTVTTYQPMVQAAPAAQPQRLKKVTETQQIRVPVAAKQAPAKLQNVNAEPQLAKLNEANPLTRTVTDYNSETRVELQEVTQDAVKLKVKGIREKDTVVINKDDSEQMSLAKYNLVTSKENAAAAEEEKQAKQEQAEQKAAEIEQLKKQLESLEKKIAAVEESHIASVQKIENAYNAKLKEAQEYINSKRQAKKTLDLISYYKDKIGLPAANPITGIKQAFSLMEVLNTSAGLTADTKSYADQLVDEAKGKMYNLGDDLYLASNHGKVVGFHADLMDKLKDMPADELTQYAASIARFSKHNDIMKPLSSLFQKLLIEKACANDACKQADSEYFVGAYAKERDFSAPKSVPQEYLPPLREIVHFDDVDYDNVPKAADGGVAKESFLNSGARIPQIWKILLNGKAFVEKDVDLAALLKQGGEIPLFMRGGRYPCKLDDKIVDVDNVDGEYHIYSSEALPKNDPNRTYRPDAMAKMPQCLDIEIESNKLNGLGGLFGKLYYTVRDKVEDVTAPAKVSSFSEYGSSQTGSELGTLLKYKGDGLFFNDAPQTVFSRLSQAAEEQSRDNSSYETNLKDEVYKRALLKNNQIGNFLRFVEQETSFRQAKEELSLSIEEAKADLFAKFKDVGFTPGENFNLALQSDYDLAWDNLMRLRNSLLSESVDGKNAVSTVGNEVAQERLEKIENLITALRKDKNAYINISDVTSGGAEMDEMIKTEEANHKVTGEYKKKADEAFEKQLNGFPIPFCAAY